MDTPLGHGVYSISEASRLTGLRAARIREWFRGRPTRPGRKPVFFGDYEPVDNDFAISFYDLIDVFVAGQLREHGVPLQTVRRAYRWMTDELGTRHPFCRRELLTDGKAIFLRGLDAEGQQELTEVLTRQKVFPEILLPFLKTIEYDASTILARRWRIAPEVVIDPAISFGKPVIEEAGVVASLLSAAYHANGRDAELVADWYNVRPGAVLAAVRFASRLAA
jgi:uncharacterized protein (DUF433 family)